MVSGFAAPAPQMALGILVVILNGFTLWIFQRTKSVKASTKYLMAYLTGSDICLGLCYFLRAAFTMTSTLTQSACAGLLDVILMSAGGSLTAIFFMYVEVYLSVKYAVRFQAWVSRTKTLVLILSTAFLWAVVGVIGFIQGNKHYLGSTVYQEENCLVFAVFTDEFLNAVCIMYILIFVIIFLCQIGVILVLRKFQMARNRIAASSTPFSVAQAIRTRVGPITHTTTNGHTTVGSNHPPQPTSQRRPCIRRQVNLTKLITAVLLFFCVCWYPFIIALLVYNICPNHCEIRPVLMSNLAILILLHGVFNFLTYFAKCQEFRHALKEALCSRCDRKEVGSDRRAADSGTVRSSQV